MPTARVSGKRQPGSVSWQPGSAFAVPPAVPLAQQQQLASGRPSESIGIWASDGRPFNSSSTPLLSKFRNYQVPAVMMLPFVISEGMAPNIGVVIQSVSISMMLDSGAEISVVPMEEVAKHCNTPVQIPAATREIRTFGNSVVTLFGPTPLELQLRGMKIHHPFYFIDAPTPEIGGYDLMRAARLVVDVDNRLVWSRRTQPSDQGWATPTPIPYVPVPNRSVYSGVLMRYAPSVQSQFHRVGRSAPPASGSGVPDNKTQPSSAPGPLPAAGPLSAQSVQDDCRDTGVKVPYSVCSTVIGQPCPQRAVVLGHTASGPSVPGFRISRLSEDLVSQSAVQSVSSCQSVSGAVGSWPPAWPRPLWPTVHFRLTGPFRRVF